MLGLLLGIFFCRAGLTVEAAPSSLHKDLHAQAKLLFQNRGFQESEKIYERLLLLSREESPYQQLEYINGALELYTFTLRWKAAIALTRHANQLVSGNPPASHSDSLQLAIYFHRLGDLGFSHSYPSRSNRDRSLSLEAFQRALTLLPPGHSDIPSLHRKMGMTLRLLVKPSDTAFFHIRKAMTMAEARHMKLEMLRCKHAIAQLYYIKAYSALRNVQGAKLQDPKVRLPLVQLKSHIATARKLMSAPDMQGLQPEDSIRQLLHEGNIAYYFHDNVPQSKRLFKQAAGIAGRRPTFSYYLRYIYNMLGLFYSEAGQYTQSLDIYKKAEVLLKKFPVSMEVLSMVYDGMGSARSDQGDKHAALPYYQQSHSILVRAFAQDSSTAQSYAVSLNNIASCLLALGEKDQFMDSSRKALQHFEMVPEDELDLRYYAKTLFNYGIVLMEKGQFESALDSLLQSSTIYERLGPTSNIELAQNHAYLGYCLVELGRTSEGDAQVEIARQLIADMERADPTETGRAANLIADFYFQRGKWQAALDLFHQVIWKLGAGAPPADYSESPAPQDVMELEVGLDALRGKANAYRDIAYKNLDVEELEKTLKIHADVIELIHVFRQQQSAQASQTDLVSKRRPAFESALDVAWRLYERSGDAAYLEQAFDFAEQSRAMVLLAAVSADQAASSTGVPDSLLLMQRDLQAQLDKLRRQKNASASEFTTARINSQMVAITAKQDSLRSLLKTEYERYYNQIYETQTVPIERIKEILGQEDRAMVEYFYGDSLLFTFAVTADTFVVQRELITEEFQLSLDTVQTVLSDGKTTLDARSYTRAAYRVYQFLLGDLPIKMPQKLLVVPDGRLNFLSFDALAHSPPPEHKMYFNHVPYLLDSLVVSYDYSFTIRERRGPYPITGPPNILAMAPSFDSIGLQELPLARAGVEDLQAKYASVKSIFGDEATEAYFRDEAHNYTILELATHGKMDSLNSADCRLHFSADSMNDGKLHLGELYSMDLNARMAVLEACESGLGPNARGEGVMSLARGFSYAGCHTIVTSLWNVADENITLEIIAAFYEKLSRKMPVDQALTEAKREYLAAGKDSPGSKLKFYKPFFWAELIVIGDTSPIPLETNGGFSGWENYGIAAILLLVLLIGMRMVKAKRKKTTS